MKAALEKLMRRENLSSDEVAEVMETIATGAADPVQTSAFLVLLQAKGHTSDEIVGLVRVMLRHAVKVLSSSDKLLDIVGTGGDGHDTINISTAAAIVAAACGAKVAKHGNRSVSSRSGSADVLEELGVPLLDPELIGDCIEAAGIAFMFAPKFHPAMKHVAPVRKALGVRTVLNILGPLLNPIHAKRLMLGVYTPDLLQVYGETLHMLGVEHALVVHCCGMDELTAVGCAKAVEVTPKGLVWLTVDPQAMGIEPCSIEDLKGGDAKYNAEEIRKLFKGDDDPGSCRNAVADSVALNAGAGLYVYGSVESIEAGYRVARQAIREGRALHVLDVWAKEANRLASSGGVGEKDAKLQKTMP